MGKNKTVEKAIRFCKEGDRERDQEEKQQIMTERQRVDYIQSADYWRRSLNANAAIYCIVDRDIKYYKKVMGAFMPYINLPIDVQDFFANNPSAKYYLENS